MLKCIPEVFNGQVEVGETYIGGQWRNKRKAEEVKKGLSEVVGQATSV